MQQKLAKRLRTNTQYVCISTKGSVVLFNAMELKHISCRESFHGFCGFVLHHPLLDRGGMLVVSLAKFLPHGAPQARWRFEYLEKAMK